MQEEVEVRDILIRVCMGGFEDLLLSGRGDVSGGEEIGENWVIVCYYESVNLIDEDSDWSHILL